MIASIEGRVSARERAALVVSVGGVGLRLFCPQPVLATARIGDLIMLLSKQLLSECKAQDRW